MTDWMEEAKRLRVSGLTQREIAARLGKARSTIARLFTREEGTHVRRDYYGMLPNTADKLKPHKYRTPKEAVPREVIAEATLAFAKGRIDRSELMRRITPA